MKYNININQRAIIENGFNIDLIDASIIDYIKDFVNSGKIVKKIIDGEEYFWIQYEYLLDEMPLLGIENKRSLSLRLEKLIKEKILEKKIINGNSTYFKFGGNYLALISTGGCTGNDKGVALEMTSINNNTINNINNNNNINNSKELLGENSKELSLENYLEKSNKEKKERKKTDLETTTTEQLIEWWKNLPSEYSFSSFRGKPGQTGWENLNKAWLVKRKQYSKEEFNKAMELYLKEIDSRSQNNSYASHRFSLYEWIKQGNSMVKFISLIK